MCDVGVIFGNDPVGVESIVVLCICLGMFSVCLLTGHGYWFEIPNGYSHVPFATFWLRIDQCLFKRSVGVEVVHGDIFNAQRCLKFVFAKLWLFVMCLKPIF